jgi:hypothetical protein
MITKSDAMTVREFYHVKLRNADGTAVRCRVNGACKTWKTRPDDFRLPVKYGLKDCFYIEPGNAADWLTFDPTDLDEPAALAMMAGMEIGSPMYAIADRLEELGNQKAAAIARGKYHDVSI